MKKETIVRTIVLFITLINQILVMFDINPLPWSESEMYEGISVIALVITTLWAWWKNNSFTKNAIKADEYLEELKNQ